MAPVKFFFFFLLLSFFLQPILTYGEFCPSVSCGSVSVEFPFRLKNIQPDCCGDPNFNLSCTIRYGLPDQPVINLPSSGDFSVEIIDYSTPYILLTDPCITKRLLQGLDLSDTPFQPRFPVRYLFFNCSSNVSIAYPAIRFSCLSDPIFSTWGIPKVSYDPSSPFSPLSTSCVEITEVLVPLRSSDWPTDYIDDIMLTWEQPYCGIPDLPCNYCGYSENNCQSENGDGDCPRKKKGLSSGTKYALIFILGAPVMLIVVCIIYYNVRVHYYGHAPQSSVETPSLNSEPRLAAITVNGLDSSRIEAYPITLLGENFKLPRPNDNTCSICLSEYQVNETIRTIPDCTHYFHSNCIDEWLKRNAACPVCRNTPPIRDSAHMITRSTLSSSSRLQR